MLYYNGELRAALNQVWNAVFVQKDSESLEEAISDLPIRRLADLVTYMTNLTLSMWTVMKPVDTSFNLPPGMLEKLPTYIGHFTTGDDEEPIELATKLYRLMGEGKYSELGETVYRTWAEDYSLLVVTIGLLSYMLYKTAHDRPHEYRNLHMRATHLRAMAVEARLKVMELPWCGSCLPHAHGIMSVLDDRNASQPMDGPSTPDDMSFLEGIEWEEP